MSVFGWPIGVLLGNVGLFPTGIGFGMVIGMLLGSRMDKRHLRKDGN